MHNRSLLPIDCVLVVVPYSLLFAFIAAMWWELPSRGVPIVLGACGTALKIAAASGARQCVWISADVLLLVLALPLVAPRWMSRRQWWVCAASLIATLALLAYGR